MHDQLPLMKPMIFGNILHKFIQTVLSLYHENSLIVINNVALGANEVEALSYLNNGDRDTQEFDEKCYLLVKLTSFSRCEFDHLLLEDLVTLLIYELLRRLLLLHS